MGAVTDATGLRVAVAHIIDPVMWDHYDHVHARKYSPEFDDQRQGAAGAVQPSLEVADRILALLIAEGVAGPLDAVAEGGSDLSPRAEQTQQSTQPHPITACSRRS